MDLTNLTHSVSAEHIKSQYDRLMYIIETDFDRDRSEKLFRMYHELEDQLVTAPASANIHYHNAYPGGYIDHILHVHDTARLLLPLYRDIGGTVDFSYSELSFVTLHHDLGKLGDEDGPYYLPETEEWWQKKGARYKYAKDTQLITVHDRTIYLLSQYEVSMTKNELIALRMADGLFEAANDRYFKNNEVFPHHSSLCYIVHWADWMAAMAEKDVMRKVYQG